MTKWLITRSSKDGAKWRVVDFNGPNGQESRGIVDLLAIRKEHQPTKAAIARGDLFEMVLVQVKGGSARMPSEEEVQRLLRVKEHHQANRVLLVEWKLGKVLRCFEIDSDGRHEVAASKVFGRIPSADRVAAAVSKAASRATDSDLPN
jgi:hypothetical protein